MDRIIFTGSCGFVGATTAYAIEKGRGYQEVALLLGEDCPGASGFDGWAPYREFEKAARRACLVHLLGESAPAVQ